MTLNLDSTTAEYASTSIIMSPTNVNITTTEMVTNRTYVFPTTDAYFGMTSATINSTVDGTTTVDMNSNSSTDFASLLDYANSYEAELLTPVTAYLIILMIIGVLGNLLVLYVYKFRFKRSTSRVFILSLAAFDLVTCVLGMPYHILDLRFPLKFVWNEICKTFSFAITFTILASIFVLDLIAIDRYRKIVTPFEKQLSAAGTKITCWVVVLISLVLALPIIFIYASADVKTTFLNVTGKECYISNEMKDSELPMVYDAFHILVFGISVLILTGLYIKVGIVVWKRRSFHDTIRNGSKRSNSGTSTPDTIVSQINEHTKVGASGSVHFKADHENASVQLFNTKSPICKTASGTSYHSPNLSRKERDLHRKRLKRLMSELSSASGDESTLERGTGNSKYASKKQMRTMRITSMLFIITLIFVVSFLPYLIISIMNGLDEEFWVGKSDGQLVIINLLMRTYFINNMINPIVYWFLDKKFKQEVKKIFRDIRKCRWSKTFRLDQKSFTS